MNERCTSHYVSEKNMYVYVLYMEFTNTFKNKVVTSQNDSLCNKYSRKNDNDWICLVSHPIEHVIQERQ